MSIPLENSQRVELMTLAVNIASRAYPKPVYTEEDRTRYGDFVIALYKRMVESVET